MSAPATCASGDGFPVAATIDERGLCLTCAAPLLLDRITAQARGSLVESVDRAVPGIREELAARTREVATLQQQLVDASRAAQAQTALAETRRVTVEAQATAMEEMQDQLGAVLGFPPEERPDWPTMLGHVGEVVQIAEAAAQGGARGGGTARDRMREARGRVGGGNGGGPGRSGG